FSFDAGTSTVSCLAPIALRIRVRRSEIGSVMKNSVDAYSKLVAPSRAPSPARFRHARDLACDRKLPETDSAELEFPQIASRACTTVATVVTSDAELRRPLRLRDHRCLCHSRSPWANRASRTAYREGATTRRLRRPSAPW